MTEQPTRPPRTMPGDIIHLPGGRAVRVLDTGTTEHLAKLKDGERIVRCGVLIVRPA